MWMVVRIPAGDITNLHYNFVVAKPLVLNKTRCTTRGLREHSLRFELNPFSGLGGDVLKSFDNETKTDARTTIRGLIEITLFAVI